LRVISGRYTCVVPQINEDTLVVYRHKSHGARRNVAQDI
jgi:hypothetical protein